MLKSLLVAVDGSNHAGRALDFACEMARRFDARLLVLSVYRHHSLQENTHSLVRGREGVDPPDEALAEQAREIVEHARGTAQERGLEGVEGIVKRGPVARTILAVAKEREADAIVLGSRGLGDVTGFLLGSVSHKVASLAECTCITVK